MGALKNPPELPFELIEARFDIASMNMGKFKPAVWRKTEGETPGYGIRILVSSSYNRLSGSRKTGWDYFYTDEAGVITQSPRGFGKDYTGRFRITGLDKAVEMYKDKPINH